MTTITLDPQPDSPKCFSTDALTAPRSVAPPQSSLNKTRLVCEWKRTADGRMTSTWTLRDERPARMPELSPEDGPRACAFEDGLQLPVRAAYWCGFGSIRARFGPSSERPPSLFFSAL